MGIKCSAKMFGRFLVLYWATTVCAQESSPVVYPEQNEYEQLATKIRCQLDEVRHFKYKSVTELWNEIDGRILLEADLILDCLGDDRDGTYGKHALKYSAQISNLNIDEKHAGDGEKPVTRRRRRGIGDFFSNAWKKIKNFFVRLFGGSPEEETESNPSWVEDRSVTEQTTTPTTEEEGNAPTEDGLETEEYFDGSKHRYLYSAPFQFIQMANGSIPEVRFADNDTDSKVRNFKRHLVDAFATQLSLKPQHVAVVETSVMGEHLSNYNITIGARSSAYSTPDENDYDDYPSQADDGGDTVVIEKVVTEDDILTLAPTSEKALNSKEKMGLTARQKQVFKEGTLLSTSGSSTLVLFPKHSKRNRKRRDGMQDTEKDVTEYFQAHSRYEIHLQARRKRSADDNDLLWKSIDGDSEFLAASRAAELEDGSARQRLRDLQMSIGNPSKFVEDLIQNIETYEPEKLQLVFEMMEQEMRLSLDNEPQSISLEIRKTVTKEVVDDICSASFKKCFDLLQLLSRAGGDEAEKIFLSFLAKEEFDIHQRQQIVDLFSDLPDPSFKFIEDLNASLKGNRLTPSLLGSLCLSVSNLATKTDERHRLLLADSLAAILESRWSLPEPKDNELLLDVLEAIGNVGHEKSVDLILNISDANPDAIEVQIACVHALRHCSSSAKVQDWMLKGVMFGSCDITYAIVGSLLDEIHKQEMAGDEEKWPRNGYNEIDAILREGLLSSAAEVQCAAPDVARYFKRKRKPSGASEEDTFFDEDTEPYEPGSTSRQKRDVWDKLNCEEWTEDNKYTPIQDRDEFASDRETYNKRKSCLAKRKLGLPGAKADIYAGMFAGVKEPSDPPKYKLFTKFVSGVNFLGHDMEIGSFYFYHHSGYTKAYVRIMGKTRQEFRHNGCTPTELKYRPITHIPLYVVRIAVLQLSLGIHLSSELSLDTLCPLEDAYDMKPLAKIRAGGEALGTVLFARAGINLGGNFNYHLRFSFVPVPDMCLTGKHGYDPMSISMEAYYQLYNAGRFRWGTPRTWRPSTLMWKVVDGRQQAWFNDTCILRAEVATPTPPTSTPTDPDLPPPGEDDDNVLVVRALR